jgi:hypothetical protein
MLSILTTDTVVYLQTSRKKFGGHVVLIRRFKIFGFVILTFEIEREEYPSWAAIQKGALGYTEWTSKLVEKCRTRTK